MTKKTYYDPLVVKHPPEQVLSVWEGEQHVPFDIKRVYHISGVPSGMVRGHHAHKELEQILICPYGEIEIVLDNGEDTKTYILSSPNKGLYVGPSMWRTMKWLKDNSVLLVLASQHYNEEDYIRDYDVFIRFTKGDR